MKRRTMLKAVAGSTAGFAARSGRVLTASCDSTATSTSVECGTWYSATVNDVVDGDTADITVDKDGKCYDVRFLAIDTPEKSGNTTYENPIVRVHRGFNPSRDGE